MHPEYPCAHCIVSGAVGTVLQAEIGAGSMPTVQRYRTGGRPQEGKVGERWVMAEYTEHFYHAHNSLVKGMFCCFSHPAIRASVLAQSSLANGLQAPAILHAQGRMSFDPMGRDA